MASSRLAAVMGPMISSGASSTGMRVIVESLKRSSARIAPAAN